MDGLTLKSNSDVKSITKNDFTYNTKFPDNICVVDKTTFYIINSIFSDGKIKGRKIKNLVNFFQSPLNSLEIGVAYCENWETETVKEDNCLNRITKVQCLPYKYGFVLIPLIE